MIEDTLLLDENVNESFTFQKIQFMENMALAYSESTYYLISIKDFNVIEKK
jgi:hypothetical protein